MSDDTDLEELDAAMAELERSTAELSARTRTEGTETERQIAATLGDLSRAMTRESQVLAGIEREQKSLRKSLDGMESLSGELRGAAWDASGVMKGEARSAADDYMRKYGQALDDLESRGVELGQKVEEATKGAAESLSKASDECARHLRRTTAASAGLIAILSVCGGVLVYLLMVIGNQVIPGASKFAKQNQPVVVILALAVLFAIWLVWCYFSGKKKHR